jgi:putative flippase GtrA
MTLRLLECPRTRRWIAFYSVGAMGILVQMSVLFMLTSWIGLRYLTATGIAVEAAVLHNFLWHVGWTWADRQVGHSQVLRRLLAFHATNGALSLAGNLILMRILVGELGLNSCPASFLAIAVCSIFNFIAGDRIVFSRARKGSPNEGLDMARKPCCTGTKISVLTTLLLVCSLSGARAAELQPGTVKAWSSIVEKTERRVASELNSGRGFLALDFQEPAAAAEERRQVLSGKIPIRQITSDAGKEKDEVPAGMIHHWRGSVFIPNVSLDSVLSRVENPRREDARQEDVLDSRVLESGPGQLKLYLKLQRSRIVTVVYNTEHMVRYHRYGTAMASSSSIATKIAEVERVKPGIEQELPEGRDHGYLWRMNSYWRYQAVNGGVIVECESITLSRSIPSLLEYLIRPLIRSVARESMSRTLGSLRTRMVQNCGLEIRDSKFKINLDYEVGRGAAG